MKALDLTMRGRGIQAEVLLSLALVMLTANGLLAAFFFETHEARSERFGPMLGRALAAEVAEGGVPLRGGVSSVRWYIVSSAGTARASNQAFGEALSSSGLALAEEALLHGSPLLQSGRPWQPAYFAAPIPGPTTGEVAVGVIDPAVPGKALVALGVADSLVFTWLGLYLLRLRVVSPLRALALAARSLGDGGTDARVPVHGVREVAEAGRAFNEMSEALERRSSALEKAVRDLRASNESLRQARDGLDRAERLAAVGHLAAGVAHEVGNPMGALLAFLDLVGRDPALSEDSRRHLARSAEQGERVRGILRQLLDFSRPPRADRVPVDMVALAEQSIGLVRAQSKYADISFALEVDPQTPVALADSSLVGQILLNLVLNAADAVSGSEAPRVRLWLLPALLRCRQGDDPLDLSGRPADAVACRVDDNGPGVSPEDRERIFDPFFTTKPPGQGTGLGLANALRLTQESSGELGCEPAPAPELGGASFVLRLPAHAEPVPSDEPANAGSESEVRSS